MSEFRVGDAVTCVSGGYGPLTPAVGEHYFVEAVHPDDGSEYISLRGVPGVYRATRFRLAKAAPAKQQSDAPVSSVAQETGAAPGNIRAETLQTAQTLVLGDRNAQYGDPRQDFQRTAALWTALLGDQLTHPIADWQVAQLMAALKLSRITHAPAKADSWVDLAGYAACGAECAQWGKKQP